MFVGVGAARVRDLFEQARAKAPAIIFIDELDALGRARGAAGPVGGHDETRADAEPAAGRSWTASTARSAWCCSAATNRPEILDPALLRAGRFDRQVLVDRPDKAGRVQILKVHVQQGAAGARRRPGRGRRADHRLHRRRPGQPVQRGGAGRHAPRRRRGDAGRLHRWRSSASSPGWRRRTACSTRASARSSPTTRWATRWWRWRCPAPTRCTRCRSSRAASARSATRSSGPPRTAS